MCYIYIHEVYSRIYPHRPPVLKVNIIHHIYSINPIQILDHSPYIRAIGRTPWTDGEAVCQTIPHPVSRCILPDKLVFARTNQSRLHALIDGLDFLFLISFFSSFAPLYVRLHSYPLFLFIFLCFFVCCFFLSSWRIKGH